MISWLGYDTPESLPGAANPNRGKDAADDMRRFSQGVRVAQGDLKSHLTFAGHSYGSFAIGAAASDKGGLHADDIIALGSPGMGVSWADQLNIDPNHVWVGQSGDDPTRLVGGWTPGENPALVGFGGHNIGIDTSGHGGYWDDGSESLANQAKIIAGRPPSTAPKEGLWGKVPLP